MSELLKDNGNFLSLILDTAPNQQKAILNTITHEQALLLGEIFLNILNIEHEDRDINFLKNKVKLLEVLSNSKLSDRYRRGFVKRHKIPIIRILLHFKENLMKLL